MESEMMSLYLVLLLGFLLLLLGRGALAVGLRVHSAGTAPVTARRR